MRSDQKSFTVENEGMKHIETDLIGIELLESAQLNKGTVFNNEERNEFS